MDKIIIYTQAYNASGTLQRTIDSVLAQTHTDWLWLLIDNGSQDNTANIVMNAARNDCRIIPFRLEKNDIRIITKYCLRMKEFFPDCYFMSLDADDMIHPQCLEKLLKFSNQHHLDIAICGTEFATGNVNPKLSDIVRVRKLTENVVIERKNYGKDFAVYKPFINEFWAKIYRFSVITEDAFRIISGFSCDSLIVMNFLKNSEKMGILAEPLHRAYIHDGSLTRTLRDFSAKDGKQEAKAFTYMKNQDWENVNRTYLGYKRYLESFGPISDENKDYLCAIYIEWIHEKLILFYLWYATNSTPALYNEFLSILHNQSFHDVFTAKAHSDKYRNLGMRKDILQQMYFFIQFLDNNGGNFNFAPALQEEITAFMKEIPEKC